MQSVMKTLVIGFIGLFGFVSAHAASISLVPSATMVQVGDTVTFTIVADFSDIQTVGGGIDVFYNDAILSFNGFQFDASLGDDVEFRRAPDAIANELNGIGFGSFNGFNGPIVIGDISFVAIAQGLVSLTLAANEGGPSPDGSPPFNPGPFVTPNGTAIDPDDLDFEGAEIEVVPIPGAAWLMLGALGVLTRLRKR